MLWDGSGDGGPRGTRSPLPKPGARGCAGYDLRGWGVPQLGGPPQNWHPEPPTPWRHSPQRQLLSAPQEPAPVVKNNNNPGRTGTDVTYFPPLSDDNQNNWEGEKEPHPKPRVDLCSQPCPDGLTRRSSELHQPGLTTPRGKTALLPFILPEKPRLLLLFQGITCGGRRSSLAVTRMPDAWMFHPLASRFTPAPGLHQLQVCTSSRFAPGWFVPQRGHWGRMLKHWEFIPELPTRPILQAFDDEGLISASLGKAQTRTECC